MAIRGAVIETAVGVILRTRPLTETSLIVHWLTRDQGRLATVAKGARRTKSVFRGKLDLFYTGEFSFSRSRHSELHTLREVGLQGTHQELRQDLARLQQACYCANLIEQATELETPLPRVFDMFSGVLDHLANIGAQPQNIFAFELKLLRESGLQPELEKTRLNPGTKLLVNALTENDWEMIGRVRPSDGQIKELGHFLHGFLIFHLGRIPKGRASAFEPR
jgi:DNA repair protein RecO (recombination protein O)